jgi:hypothetical protein
MHDNTVSFGRGRLSGGMARVPYAVGSGGTRTSWRVVLTVRYAGRIRVVPGTSVTLRTAAGARGALVVHLNAAARRELVGRRAALLSAEISPSA